MNKNQEKIRDVIDRYYDYDHIKVIYHKLLKPLVQANISNLQYKKIRFGENVNKNFLLDFFSAFLNDLDLRELLFNSFSSDMKIVLESVVWRGEVDDAEVEKLIKKEIVIMTQDGYFESGSHRWIQDKFKLFCIDVERAYEFRFKGKVNYQIYLPLKLRVLFKGYFKTPEEANLRSYQTAEAAGATKYSFLFQQAEKSPNELQLAQMYFQQGLLSFNKQNKATKASLKKMKVALECHEYYQKTSISATNTIHVNLLSLICQRLDFYLQFENRNKKKQTDISSLSGMELLKFYYSMLREGKSFSVFSELLDHLKNKNQLKYYEGYDEDSLHKNILSELEKLNPSSWVNFEQWATYLNYNSIDINVIDLHLASEYLYCNIETTNIRFSYDREYVNTRERLVNMVQKPLLKSCLFLYASLGLIDICYSDPFNPFYNIKDKDYLSIYDGLECFRLTELGAYILGQTKSYELKQDSSKKARIIIDEQRLLITFHGKDMLKQAVLNQMTHKVSENHYKMDYESLLAGCSSVQDIEKRINQFKQLIMKEPPANWQLFFKQVIEQANPLKHDPNLVVFKLKEQATLYQVIASDPVLKKHILKAEDFHIVVELAKIAAVKKRLLTLGYFM